MKALTQSKEELEKCIKEQETNKDVSVPKTDDLVDEVVFLKPKFTFTLFFVQVAALQDENGALRTKIEVLEEESVKKVTFYTKLEERNFDRRHGVWNLESV